jgi:HAD superfamily hydrolase (TIGR01509 family)
MQVKAIIFDFDGLIADTESAYMQSWQEVFGRFGAAFQRDRFLATIGSHPDDIGFDAFALLEEAVGHECEREGIESARAERELELAHQQPTLPGVREYIADALRLGMRLAVASSSPRVWVEGHLDRLGLSRYFSAVKTADDVERIKPSPLLFQAALEALGLAPEEAFAIEDSLNGLKAAKGAGLFCVVVPNAVTHILPFDGADVRLKSLLDMPFEQLLALIHERRADRAASG